MLLNAGDNMQRKLPSPVYISYLFMRWSNLLYILLYFHVVFQNLTQNPFLESKLNDNSTNKGTEVSLERL